MRQLIMGWLAVAVILFCGPQSRADIVEVVSGQTNIFLDPTVLTLLGISVTGTTGTITPAPTYTLAYPISARDAIPNTTFSYDPADFANTFSGVIEHTGTLTFTGPTTLGDFTIGFDASRVGAGRSGFFVGDNVDLNAPLFDVATPSTLVTEATRLQIVGDLLLSLEAATALGNDQLAGLNMGRTFVDAVSAVPEPSSMLLLAGVVAAGAVSARRRNKLVRLRSA